MRLLTFAIAMVVSCGPEGHDPQVAIAFPRGEEAFPEGTVLELLGEVWDPDGIDDVEEVAWRSDLDGLIPGEATFDDLGRVSLTATLTGGAHTLRFEAVDAEGNSAFDEVTVSIAGFPTAYVVTPADGSAFIVGMTVVFQGVVNDPDQAPDTLSVGWSRRPASGADETPMAADTTTPEGETRVTWADVPEGSFVVTLRVTDGEGHVATDEVQFTTSPGDASDLDGDGVTSAQGDCDDADSEVKPGVDEACNEKDDDCNSLVDDKDLDLDGFVDSGCVHWPGTNRTDCDDDSFAIKPGATEVQDLVDNNCDGEVDEGTAVYDDDGDCYCDTMTALWSWCEQGTTAPCIDGVDDSCPSLQPGDCDDGDANIHPAMVDEAEWAPPFVDSDCDCIDGDVETGVFLAPPPPDSNGNDGNDCTLEAPCATLSVAMAKLTGSSSRRHLYIQKATGPYTGTITALDGLEIHGGYGDRFQIRDRYDVPGWEVRIVGGSAPGGAPVGFATLYANAADDVRITNLVLQGPVASGNTAKTGESSYVVHAVGSSITLQGVRLERGAGADGQQGADGANLPTNPAEPGSTGGQPCSTSGCTSAGGTEGSQAGCPDTALYGRPRGGTGGAGGGSGPPAQNGVRGDDAPQASGAYGGGGTRGTAGSSDETCPGSEPQDGEPGLVTNGASGGAGTGGVWSGFDWTGGTGQLGGLGLNGGGGGGGGGAGGCFYVANPSHRWTGAAGGGGGSGGCRNEDRGGGGGAGGAAVGIYASGTTLALAAVDVAGGAGGDGGRGGYGGAGQPGGTGGSGGSASADTPSGGRGGDGAHGGHAGGGGGGAGGMIFGVVLDDGSAVTTSLAEVTHVAGTPGQGGPGGEAAYNSQFTDGNDGATGAAGSEVQVAQP